MLAGMIVTGSIRNIKFYFIPQDISMACIGKIKISSTNIVLSLLVLCNIPNDEITIPNLKGNLPTLAKYWYCHLSFNCSGILTVWFWFV